jgi:methionine synthase / methylenetetrahydrofolate reductase(NADPH)
VIANPTAPNLDDEIRRFEYKAEAGAEFAVTQPIFDLDAFDAFQRRTAHVPLPIIAAVRPFDSLLHAEYLANEVPNIRVPDALLARMRRADAAEAAAAEGVAIAQELARDLRQRAQGLQVGGPMPSIFTVLDGL